MTTLTFEQYEALTFEEKMERINNILQSQLTIIKNHEKKNLNRY